MSCDPEAIGCETVEDVSELRVGRHGVIGDWIIGVEVMELRKTSEKSGLG